MKRHTRGGGVAAVMCTPQARFTPKNLRQVRPRAISCPDCKAKPGDSCVTAAGGAMKDCHRSRKRMAVRAFNAANGLTA